MTKILSPFSLPYALLGFTFWKQTFSALFSVIYFHVSIQYAHSATY